jgi:hypothetical protein
MYIYAYECKYNLILDYIYMRIGTYEQDMGVKYASMFLGFEQMTVQERADGKCVCKGIRNMYTYIYAFYNLLNCSHLCQ